MTLDEALSGNVVIPSAIAITALGLVRELISMHRSKIEKRNGIEAEKTAQAILREMLNPSSRYSDYWNGKFSIIEKRFDEMSDRLRKHDEREGDG